MIEKEAKEKWCPFTRFTDKDATALGNRSLYYGEDVDTRARCIGADCMAWREAMGNPRYGYCGAFWKPDFTH